MFSYFLITLLPVIGIIKVGSQAAADRYTYLPMISFYIAFAGGLSILLNKYKRSLTGKSVLILAALIISVTLSFLTHQQNRIWENDETLWRKALSLYPGLASRAYSNLATYRFNNGDFKNAKLPYSKALALEPKNLFILENMGRIHEQLGNDRIAFYYFSKLIRIYPNLPYGYTLVGDYYYARNQLTQAKRLYNKAFNIAPYTPATLQRKALVNYLNNNLEAAQYHIKYLLKLTPNDIGALQLAARVYLKTGNIEKSRQFADKIFTLNPNDSFATDIINTIEHRNNS
jgi:tetratricopeptide (TPR) repeat protein